METLILDIIPGIVNEPTLLYIADLLFTFFFGGFIYSFVFGLFNGYRRN